MKIYYSNINDTIVIEGIQRYFNTSLIATEVDGKVAIKDEMNNSLELLVNYTKIKRQNGDPAGTNNVETINYLNIEFSKKREEGEATFINLNNTVTINVLSGKSDSKYIVTPISSSLNEILHITNISNGNFTVRRVVITALGSLTSNLKFFWKRIS